MIVVSDTTPLNYLILVDSVHVLPSLFVRVHAPWAVITELSHSRTPEAVRRWVASPPAWLTVQDPTSTDASLKLGSGETAAIALGQELKADWILIDERKGTREARGRGLRVAGTLIGERDDFPRHRSGPEGLRAAIPRPAGGACLKGLRRDGARERNPLLTGGLGMRTCGAGPFTLRCGSDDTKGRGRGVKGTPRVSAARRPDVPDRPEPDGPHTPDRPDPERVRGWFSQTNPGRGRRLTGPADPPAGFIGGRSGPARTGPPRRSVGPRPRPGRPSRARRGPADSGVRPGLRCFRRGRAVPGGPIAGVERPGVRGEGRGRPGRPARAPVTPDSRDARYRRGVPSSLLPTRQAQGRARTPPPADDILLQAPAGILTEGGSWASSSCGISTIGLSTRSRFGRRGRRSLEAELRLILERAAAERFIDIAEARTRAEQISLRWRAARIAIAPP